jgi:hypothetical protein
MLRIRIKYDNDKIRPISLLEIIEYSIKNRTFKIRYIIGFND